MTYQNILLIENYKIPKLSPKANIFAVSEVSSITISLYYLSSSFSVVMFFETLAKFTPLLSKFLDR